MKIGVLERVKIGVEEKNVYLSVDDAVVEEDVIELVG